MCALQFAERKKKVVNKMERDAAERRFALRELRRLVGAYAVRLLRKGKALLHVCRCTTPHNVWIAPVSRDHVHLWHSSDRGYPRFSMFELVMESDSSVSHSFLHRDGGRSEHSVYALRKEFCK